MSGNERRLTLGLQIEGAIGWGYYEGVPCWRRKTEERAKREGFRELGFQRYVR